MTYEEWRAEQEAAGFKGRRSTPEEDFEKLQELKRLADEGMHGYNERGE